MIWSTLEDTRKWVPLNDSRMPTLMGKYKVPHFDAKGEANHVFSDLGLPVTFLLTSFYWDNFIHLGMGLQRASDGALVLTLPMGDKKLPGIASGDIGKCVHGVFQRGREFINQTIGIAAEHLTGAEMAHHFARRSVNRYTTTRLRRKNIAAWASPARRIWATCSSSSATSRRISAARAASSYRAS